MKTEINKKAPVVEKQDILVEASPEKIWDVLTDVDNWPSWQSEVTSAKLDGTIAESSGFQWKSGGSNLTSVFHTVAPYNSLGWTGKAIGTFAIHNWKLEQEGEGTRVHVEESLEGFLPWLLKSSFKKMLQKHMKKNLSELKSECEK